MTHQSETNHAESPAEIQATSGDALQARLAALMQENQQMRQQLAAVGVLPACDDCTQQEQEKESQLKQFLDAVPVGVFVADGEGKPYYLNQSGKEILHLGNPPGQLDEIKQHQTFIAGTEIPYPLERRPIVQALQGHAAKADDIEVHTGHGVVPLESLARPILDSQGRVIFVVSAFQNISERRAIEQERRQFTESLEQKVRERTTELLRSNEELLRLNQEKNEFLGIAAHDLKNPLAAIQGMAEAIRDMADVAVDTREYAEMIHASARKMLGLVTNLLDVNNIESNQIKPHVRTLDILPLLTELLRFHRTQAIRKGISLELAASESVYYVQADDNVAQQILDNLLSNAVKYSPFGKKVCIRVDSRGLFVRCAITDQGPGLSEQDQAKLFTKFTKLTPQPTGGEHSTGLGLFIVYKLAAAMNCKVYCESSLGTGSTFSVLFPLAEEQGVCARAWRTQPGTLA